MYPTVVTATLAAWNRALAVAADVIEKRNTIPILDCVRLTAVGETSLKIEATDMDMTAQIMMRCAVIGPTSIAACVMLRPLKALFNALGEPGDMVGLSFEEKALVVRLPGRSYTFARVEAEPYSGVCVRLSENDPLRSGAMLGEEVEGQFREAMRKCLIAASTETTRYYLNGVHLWAQDGVGRICGTDGHCLHMWRSGIDGTGVAGIVPMKAARIVANIADLREVIVSAGKIEFVWGDLTFTAKLIDGTYPDVMRVVPKEDALSHTITVKLDQLEAAVNRLRAGGSERHDCIALGATGDEKLVLHVHETDYDTEFNERVLCDIEAKEGTAVAGPIGFKRRYLLQALVSLHGHDKVTLRYYDNGAPILIHPTTMAIEPNCVIMPMRLDGRSEEAVEKLLSEP